MDDGKVDGLSAQIVLVKKGVDGERQGVAPNRVAQDYRVVVGDIRVRFQLGVDAAFLLGVTASTNALCSRGYGFSVSSWKMSAPVSR